MQLLASAIFFLSVLPRAATACTCNHAEMIKNWGCRIRNIHFFKLITGYDLRFWKYTDWGEKLRWLKDIKINGFIDSNDIRRNFVDHKHE
jgi:hypothetical protein